MRLPDSWYRACNWTLLATLCWLGNAWLFAFTKAPGNGDINNVSWHDPAAGIFLLCWLIAACGLCAANLPAAGAARLLGRRLPRAARILPFLLPSLVFALTLLTAADSVTHTRYGFSSADTSELSPAALRVCVFILGMLALGMALRMQMRRNAQPCRASCAGAVLLYAVLLGLLAAAGSPPPRTADALYVALIGMAWARIAGTLAAGTGGRMLETRLPGRILLACASAGALYAALALAVFDPVDRAVPPRTEPMPNILLLTLESFLTDQMTLREGAAVDTTPFLRGLARESFVAENHFSNASNTRESLDVLVSGLLPIVTHGQDNEPPEEDIAARNLLWLLRRDGAEFSYVPQDFSYSGTLDRAFLTHPVPPPLERFLDEHYVLRTLGRELAGKLRNLLLDDHPQPLSGTEDLRRMARAADRAGLPFIGHIHVLDSHSPYEEACDGVPPATYLGTSAAVGALGPAERCYRGKMRKADEAARRIVATLEELGKAGNTVLVVTGDHVPPAPMLEDAPARMRAAQRTPLFIRFPHGRHAGEVLHVNAQTADILPTLLDYLELPPAPWGAGTSLLRPDAETALRYRPILVKKLLDHHHARIRVIVCDRYEELDLYPERAEDLHSLALWKPVEDRAGRCDPAIFPGREEIFEGIERAMRRPSPAGSQADGG